MLLFTILLRLFKNHSVFFSLLVVLLFLVHPIHTEVVSNIKCRDELLAFLFGLAACFFLMEGVEQDKTRPFIYSVFFLFLALLCKRTAILFIVFIPLVMFFFTGINFKKAGKYFLILSVSAISYKLFQSLMLHGSSQLRDYAFFENPLFFESGLAKHVSVALYVMGYYIKLLLVPYPLCCYYGYNVIPMAGWDSIWVWISLGFYIFIGAYALLKFTSRSILSCSILIFLIGIFPFINLVEPVVGIVGERFVYFASLGFCIAVVYLLFRGFGIDLNNKASGIKNLKSSFVRISSLLLVFFIGLSISRNNKWKDKITLFRNDSEDYPNSCHLHHLLANAIYPEIFNTPEGPKKAEMIREATFHFTKELELMKEGVKKYPTDALSLNNIGIIYTNIFNDPVSAQPYFRRAVFLRPDFSYAQYNYASCFQKRNLPDSAIALYEKMVSSKTNYAPTYFSLYELYLQKGEYKKAIDCNEKGIAVIPKETKLYINLGNSFLRNGDTLDAVKQYKKAEELEPDNQNLRQEISVFLKAIGYS
jgi:tetratricopeptide (TPR) repeat protein